MIVSFLAFPFTLWGQVGPPGGGGTGPVIAPLVAHVKITKPVTGLTFNATIHRQEAVFACSLSDEPAVTAGCTRAYAWSVYPQGALTFDHPDAASTSARSSGIGIFYVTCGLVDSKPSPDGESQMIMAATSNPDTKECAAIGGPIRVSVSGNARATYNHDKNDKTKSWYMTYYGTGEEATHNATMKIDDQPTITRQGIVKGTTITWTLPGSTSTADSKTTQFDAQGNISVQPLSVLAKATGAFQNGEPKVRFHFDDGVISGDADDNSAQFQISQGTAPNITWVSLVYKVSGHVPKNQLVRASPPTLDQEVSQPPNTTYWTKRAQIKYVLRDTNDDLMPGVYIQERFTDGNPRNLITNKQTGFVWHTVLDSTLDSGIVATSDGTFNGFDFLYYPWPTATASIEMTTHSYYAGTSDASDQATTGIFLGIYDITFTPGQPGTATQTDPLPPNP